MLALMGSLLLGALTTHCAKMKVQMCNGGWQEKMAFLLFKLKIQKSVINCPVIDAQFSFSEAFTVKVRHVFQAFLLRFAFMDIPTTAAFALKFKHRPVTFDSHV